jgi:Uma2 family endonuclease
VRTGDPKAPPFAEGERLSRAAFHARYLLKPEAYHAELIGGVVRLSRPKPISHSRALSGLNMLLGEYEERTAGVEALLRVTVLLDDQSEPQPDLCLLIAREGGGQTWDEDEIVAGPPELVVEVADSSERETDLGPKHLDYERAGVLEYLVVIPGESRAAWFVREGKTLCERSASDGVIRCQAFPGLWLDVPAILAVDRDLARATLAAGFATPEHDPFVARLEAHSGESPS